MTVPRICVIGAGPAGLSTLIQIKLRQEEGHGPYDVTCYESQPIWGGIWNLTWRTGRFFILLLLYDRDLQAPIQLHTKTHMRYTKANDTQKGSQASIECQNTSLI